MLYTATISSTSLRLRQSRIVADLLLHRLSDAAWKDAVVELTDLPEREGVTASFVASCPPPSGLVPRVLAEHH